MGRAGRLAALALTPGASVAQPVAAGLQLWLRADAGVQSGTGVAATDGQAVALWLDQSGHGRDLAQADTGSRPLWLSTGLNGTAVLRFDGTNDWLFGSQIPSLGGQDSTISAVAAGSASGGVEPAIFADASWSGAVLQREFASFRYWSNYQQGKGQPEVLGGGSLPSAGFSARIFSVQRSVGSQIELALDGTVVASAGSGGVVQPYVGGTLSVGGHVSPGYGIAYAAWGGDIAEVLVYDRRLAASEFNAVGGYLEQKYGLDTVFQPVPEPATWGLMLVGLWCVRRVARKL